jgi:hypothetical protein
VNETRCEHEQAGRPVEEIKGQPEPVLIEVWYCLRFLTRQREEEAWSGVLPSRHAEQEVLDHLDSK